MIEVQGADHLAGLAKALKAAGEKDLQKEMYAGINRAVKPAKEAIKQSMQTALPQAGGLAKAVGKSSLRTQRRTSVRGAAGVRIVAKSKYSLYHLNQGQVRHWRNNPRRVSSVQRINPGFWSDPLEAVSDDVRRELVAVLNDITAKLNRSPGG